MVLNDLIEYFGSCYQFNKKTGMSHNNYQTWKKLGFIPIESQLKIQKMTNFDLKANLDHLFPNT